MTDGPPPDRRPLAAAAALAPAFAAYAAYWLARRDTLLSVDLWSFYAAARAAAKGWDMYALDELKAAAVDGGLKFVFPYVYPPFFAFVAAPWGELTARAARFAWLVLNLALIAPVVGLTAVAAGDALAAAGRDRQRARALALVLGTAALLVLPFGDNLYMGQINIVVLAFMVLALALDARGGRAREIAAGAALAVAALIKVWPALLALLFLARRRYRTAASFVLSGLALALLTLPLGAGQAWLRFWEEVPRFSHGSSIPGLAPPGFVPNFALAGLAARLLPDDPGAVKLVSLLAAALLLAALLWAWRRAGGEGAVLLLPLLVLMIVSAPYAYRHHVVYLFPGVVLALTDLMLRRGRGWLPAAVAVAALAVLAGVPFPTYYEQWGLPVWATSLNLYALLGLFVVGLMAPARAARPAPALEAPAQSASPM